MDNLLPYNHHHQTNPQKKYHPEFDRYMEMKIRNLSKKIYQVSCANQIVNFCQLFFNLLILILFVLTIWWSVAIKTKKYGIWSFLSAYQDKLTTQGFIYVIVLATATLVLFVLSLFMGFYKTTMKWREYRKVQSELQYLYLYYQKKDYSLQQFATDLQLIEKKYLAKEIKVGWKKLLTKNLKDIKQHVK